MKNRNLLYTLSLVLWAALFSACNTSTSKKPDIVVEFKGRALFLTQADLAEVIPRHSSPTDSLQYAVEYTTRWVKDVLIADMARKNLNDERDEINKLVDDYRKSLTRQRYTERLLRNRLVPNLSESNKLNYYEENQQLFKLEKGLIQGLFLKIPIDAPNLPDVKKWYKSTSEEALEKIEKYSLQNATIYDYFYDRWINFDDVIGNMPIHISNTNRYLKANKYVEVQDSSFCYLLNIGSYLPIGAVAPYDYAMPQIEEMLLNKQRLTFIKEFEDELYNEAMNNGTVLFTTESESATLKKESIVE